MDKNQQNGSWAGCRHGDYGQQAALQSSQANRINRIDKIASLLWFHFRLRGCCAERVTIEYSLLKTAIKNESRTCHGIRAGAASFDSANYSDNSSNGLA